MFKHPIEVRFLLGKDAVIVGKEDVVPFVLSLRGVKAGSRPMLLIAAIDASYSMNGEKIYKAKEALMKLLDHLAINDRVVVYGFHGKVFKVLDETPVSERDKISRAILELKLGFGTNLYGILERIYEEAKKACERLSRGELAAVRYILLTDGIPTTGQKKPSKIVEIAKRIGELGVSGLVIGVGNDYNEKLLMNIALATNSRFEHIDRAEAIVKAIEEYVSVAREISARDVVVELKLVPGANAVIYGREYFHDNGKIVVRIGDIPFRENTNVVGELYIPPQPLGKRFLGRIEVKYLDIESGDTRYASPIDISLLSIAPEELDKVMIREDVYAAIRAVRAAESLREKIERRSTDVKREIEEIAQSTLKLGDRELYSRTLSIKKQLSEAGIPPELYKQIASLITKILLGEFREEH